MDNLTFTVQPTGVSATYTTAAFRLDAFTDEANGVDWVSNALANIGDPSSRTHVFNQVPRGPSLFTLRTIGGAATADLDAIWSNSSADVALWCRVPGTFLSSFSGIRRTWAWGTDTWLPVVESTWRFCAISVRITALGLGGTFAMDVRSLASAPHAPSTWKLASTGLFQ